MASSKASSNSLMVASWDPMQYINEQPKPSCLTRVTRDIAEMNADPLPGIFISPEEIDLTRIHAIVVGPQGTPYEGGFFHFFMKCPPNYPVVPPQVRIMTTDAGRVRFNPNLYACGKVCLSILETFPGPAWSPVQNIGTVLISIQSLMNEEPYYNEPCATPLPVLAARYSDRVRHDTVRVAICDAVEACLRDEPPYPAYLASVVLKTLADSYDKYEDMVKRLVDLNNSWRLSWILGMAPTYGYEPLLTRLKELGPRVKDKIAADAAADVNAQ
ncbi:ubiquitin-conjugating enzyme E2 Z [Rhipicephalus microplus]|uniref:ubiquitin-conjugating enzyme E2 Z n=1 Tax=Rhipicephalus microplus TaxID=6941 RepID=UPI003F6A6883